MRIIDEREAKIEASTKAADEAKLAAEKAEEGVEAELKKARTIAADIVATAKSEATAAIEKAEKDAKTRSERIVADAHESLGKEVLKAREALKKDTLELVKQAAGLATAHVADSKLDTAVLKKSLDSVRSTTKEAKS